MKRQETFSPVVPPDAHSASAFWFIGSGAECAYQVSSGPGRIAVLLRRGSRLFVRDLANGGSVAVNQTSVPPGEEMEITRYDLLEAAGAVVEIEPCLFLGQTQFGIDTTALFLPRPEVRSDWLCEGAFLRARQSSFTAILGPAGCGKTVLLNLLNGCIPPSQGRIIIGQLYDIHCDGELLRNYLGYVPQDDVMVPELTVRQSLEFRLRLRFPDMAPSVRSRLILHTCCRLGLHASRVETYLDSAIGSPELGRRGLSGGERRRANIAHELVMKPAILLLDEPTSGLASVDAECVVGLLQSLAREEHLTIVTTIHQPSRESFASFDDLMVMSHGGRVAYYGPAARAVSFFERATEESFAPSDNPAEYVLRHLDKPHEADHVVRFYAKQGRELPKPLSDAPRETEHGRLPDAKLADRLRGARDNFKTLLQRNLAVALADRFSLWLALAQAPLIAMLIWLAFIHFPGDAPAMEHFNRSLYHFSVNQEAYFDRGENGQPRTQVRPEPIDSVVAQSLKEGRTERGMVSAQMAQRRGAVYFVLTAAAIWLGVVSGCREIVVEIHVLRREARACIRVGPYLAAKLTALMTMTAIQCGVLTVLVAPWLLEVPPLKLAGLWLALWVTSGAAGSLGLLISALAPTYRGALTAVPLVLIPQLLFGGLLRPHPDMASGTAFSRVAGWLTVQRWGFESAMSVDPSAPHGVMLPHLLPGAASAKDVFEYIRDLEFKDGSLAAVFFGGNSDGTGFALPLLILAAQAAIFLALCHHFLIRRLGIRRPA